MDNQIAERITEQVTVPMVLSRYGYSTSPRKRIPCPLHSGKDPNFCYTDQVFHCWTCGAKGNGGKPGDAACSDCRFARR